MSAKIDDKRRLKFAAQGLRKTAISLQAAVVSLLQTADALSAETDDNLVENNPLDVNLQDLLKGDINSALIKLLNNALNNEGEALDDDQRAEQNGKRAANGVKKSTRKPRPPRDPNAPTKPQNAFILFQKDIASQVKSENPDKSWPEIVHLISARWKALPKEEKEVYERRFEEAKLNYATEYKTYIENKKKDQVVTAVDPDGLEENNDTTESNTPDSQSTASQSDEEEVDIPNPSNSRSSRSKMKPNTSAKNAPHPNSESSKKKSKKRRTQDDDDDESANEEEENYELSKKLKKKASNEEGGEVQGKERKKAKKSSREEEKDLDTPKKKKNRKNKD
ncbi:hypothetical protein RclHR1_06670014 [Rhizophagus clarus]|uniref:HMG box domain-containing protein n=1 Tax=Rhizophagus clarus TaxID=94130 RepID=A0A2Z6RTT3_9GLOM|nr:hypothetical protein RclHR1_06670014 [Rhizophagus clarus]